MNYNEMSIEELCLELKEKINSKKVDLESDKNYVERYVSLMEINKNTIMNINNLEETVQKQQLLGFAMKSKELIERFHKEHLDRINVISDQIVELTQLYIDLKPRCNRIKLAYLKSLRSLRNFCLKMNM